MVSINAVETLPVLRRHREEIYPTTDQIAAEVPVALVYNGISHAVMMATPQHLKDFALGFSLTEGIIEKTFELYEQVIVPGDVGIEVRMQLSERRFHALKQKRRSLTGQTGCGICGTESLQQFHQLPSRVTARTRVSANAISKAMSLLPQQQLLNQQTGATHAAAWVDIDGNIILVREDIGRHNALDKLIGALYQQQYTVGFLLITSRASYEMVLKAAKANINILTAISAPTSLAINLAEKLGITLLGFTRDERFVSYSNDEGITELKSHYGELSEHG